MLEIIATSVEDVKQLDKSKCDRIELCVDMELDGLSPSIDLVHECLLVAKVPIRIMLRFEGNFELNNIDSYIEYIDKIKEIDNGYLEGFVLGFIKNETIDNNINKLIEKIAPYKVTLHKAHEELIANDNYEELKKLYHQYDNIDTILTQGGTKPILDNLDKLEKLNTEFNLLLGGGVSLENIEQLLKIKSDIHVGKLVRENNDYNNEYNNQIIYKLKKTIENK